MVNTTGTRWHEGTAAATDIQVVEDLGVDISGAR